ncbi:MAG: iron ABC transporter permease [Methanomassiliicoccus sp.]|nr:iron ABC transporter permease [Methanomassiliicoccus sp.]
MFPLKKPLAEPGSAQDGGNETARMYLHSTARKFVFLGSCIIILLLLMMVSITVGTFSMPLGDVINALLGHEGTYYNIIWNIRMPRIIAGMLAGASLALAGTVMQCVLRNPLASPYTLGLSQSAAFGAAFAIIFLGAGSTMASTTTAVMINNPYVVTMMAFVWAIVGTLLIMALSALTRVSPEAMILAGVAIAAIFQAGITALQFFADSVQLSTMVYWTFGDLGRMTWEQCGILAAVLVPLLLYFIYNRWSYNAMDAGEETANGLGVNTKRMRMVGMLLSSLLAAVVVSFMGIIGFIGLVAPHMTRRIIGGDHRFLIPGSALVGAILLMGSDTVARTVISPLVIPVGVITAFLGGPLFIYLLVKGYRK